MPAGLTSAADGCFDDCVIAKLCSVKSAYQRPCSAVKATSRLDEFQNVSIANRRAPDGSRLVDLNPFWKTRAAVGARVRDEGRDDAVVDAADVDPAMEARVVAVD